MKLSDIHIKGEGGYVVTAPSLHPEGGKYSVFIDGEILKIEGLQDVFDLGEPPPASQAQYGGKSGRQQSQSEARRGSLPTTSTYNERSDPSL